MSSGYTSLNVSPANRYKQNLKMEWQRQFKRDENLRLKKAKKYKKVKKMNSLQSMNDTVSQPWAVEINSTPEFSFD